MLKGFKAFVMRGNIVDLAIAVVLGAAFGSVVTALVEDFVTPLIAALFGENDFSALTFTINDSVFRYGHFLNAVISFVSVAAAIYFIVVVPMQRIAERRKKGEVIEDTPAPSDEAVLLTEIRDLLRNR
jgi:large conductance mechanosensitive channel